ncbi:MAG: methyl-accepting chemotaxis protein [Bacteroidales bacterium]
MKFKDFKIGTKIMTGYAVVALAALIIGIVGLYSLRNVGRSFHEVSDVRMPSVQYLLEVEAGFENLNGAFRTMLNPNLSAEEKARQHRIIADARTRFGASLEAFELLPQTDEEAVLWRQFREAMDEWRATNDEFSRILTQVEELDIFYPMQFLGNLNRFQADHYSLQVQMANAIEDGNIFTGGEDPTACNLGRWIPTLETSNRTINDGIANMRQSHDRFHHSVHEAKDHLSRGNRTAARNVYQNSMIPAAEEVFTYFDILIAEAETAVRLFEQMEIQNMVVANEAQQRCTELLEQVIDMNIDIAHQETANGDQIISASNILVTVIIVAGIIIAILLGLFITRAITGGITRGVSLAEEIAQGDLTVNVDSEIASQKDEIGQLGRALQLMIEKLRGIIGDIVSGADNISSASTEMSSSSQQMSQGATEQASSAEEVSSSMEEMVSNIQQNTDNAQQTEKIAQNVSAGMRKVSESAGESLESIRNIASKINIINDIAFQTNILALNAAVEAARAGEHGRGFAVVAAEVRKLAERSKIAADEIVALATSSVHVTEESGKLMGDLIPDIEKTARLVQEITAASLEQNSGADQINNAIQQLNQIIQQNAAVSEEMATSSEELAGQAEQLKDTVSYFTIEFDRSYRKSALPKAGKVQKTSAPVKSKKIEVQAQPAEKKGVDLKMFNEAVNDNDYEKF